MRWVEKKIKKYIKEYIKEIILDSREEEILKKLEEIEAKSIAEKEKLELELRIAITKEEKIVKSVIKILDSIEWLENIEDEKLKNSIKLTRKIINREVDVIKLKKIGEENSLYNEGYYNCLGYREEMGALEGEILEIIKPGYVYGEKLLRQGEVIVNKKGEERDEYNRDRPWDYHI